MKSKSYKNAESALAAVRDIYDRNVETLRQSFQSFTKGQNPQQARACYPFVRITVDKPGRMDKRLSYGFSGGTGVFETTLTRPDIFDYYYRQQFELLIKNHDCKIEVGESDTPIPVHFALGEDFHPEGDVSEERLDDIPTLFDRPELATMDDEIANCRYKIKPGMPSPLSLFTAPRVDLSLLRLRHYTATSAMHFQNYILYTNYQFYIDEFIKIGRELAADPASDYTAFVEPGEGKALPRLPQMPAYHLKRADGSGITMINIGVGPSNAKTITDHVAVLRPHAWLMLGHCAGLRNSQKLGDYVLAHAYLRLDHVLDADLSPAIPVPPLAEVQQALQASVADITGQEGYELKNIMRTGTVATIDDRNWELQPSLDQNLPLSQSRAIALDMESGTIAANGFRFRVPYGTLLCVSDKPLHGQLKLPGMADSFYRERVNQHLQIGLKTMEKLREIGPDKLHSRKLRAFSEVAFQ